MYNHVAENFDFQSADDLREAVRLHREGRRDEAREIYLRILERFPQNADALHLLGVVEHQNGEFKRAVDLIGQAIQLAPGQASLYLNLGNAYQESGLMQQAEACFRKSIEIEPQYAEAYFNLGNILSVIGNTASAIESYQHAVLLDSNQTAAYLRLGSIFEDRKDYGQAIFCLQKVLRANPDHMEIRISLGLLYQKNGNHRKAVQCLGKAISSTPAEDFRLYNNMGVSFQAMGNLAEAINCFEKAVELNANYAAANYNLGIAFQRIEDWKRSIDALKRTVSLQPDNGRAYNLLVHLLQKTCDWKGMDHAGQKLDRLTEAAIEKGTPAHESPYLNVSRHADPALNLALARKKSMDIAHSVSHIDTRFGHDHLKPPVDKISLGYYSDDFRDHPIGHLTRGLFGSHNRQEFNVYCYSTGRNDGSIYRDQIARECDRFVDIHGMDAHDAAQCIYRDNVGILVDLGGHTNGNRLDVCALRPAAIQATYLGFPGTSGADFFDYIFTDRIVSPEAHEIYISEMPVYLPNSYQINNDCQEITDKGWRRRDLGLGEDQFIFSSFNQSLKIEKIMFDSWMNILKKVPDSILWLLRDNATGEHNLKLEARKRGVDPRRLVFAPKMTKADHLARLRLADLVLDTRIYNGHTTTSDALWAGVPVITKLGTHFASRVSASLLYAIGLPQLVADSLEDYEAIAVELALDGEKLATLRNAVRKNRRTKPLFNTALFVTNLENAYREMWRIFQNGEPPRRLDMVDLS